MASHAASHCATESPRWCCGNVAVNALVSNITDPRVSQLSELQTRVNRSLLGLDSSLESIAMRLNSIQTRLAELDQPVSLRAHPSNDSSSFTRFIPLSNTESGVSSPYNSLGLDLMLPASGASFG